MSDFDKFYLQLKTHVARLEMKLIGGFLKPSLTPSSDYDEFVKAYCILSHAAIEEYFEKTALRIMEKSLDDWLTYRKYHDSLFTLACCYKMELKIDLNEQTSETKIFDYLRPLLDDVKQKFSNYVRSNHGASVKYLRRLMIPVAIDIIDDPTLLNSLNQLAAQRGDYAHNQVIKKILSPEDARDYVNDTLKVCADIKDKANAKFL